MQLSSIKNFVTSSFSSAGTYFKESSWQGKTVQVICTISCLSLCIYLTIRSIANKNLSNSKPLPIRDKVFPSLTFAVASYEDKGFVKNLLSQIETSHGGAEFYTSIPKAKHAEQAGELDWIGGNCYAKAVVAGLLKQRVFEKNYQDLRLQGYDLQPWQQLEQELRNLSQEYALITPTCEDIHKKEPYLKFIGCLEKLQKLDQERQDFLKKALFSRLEKITFYVFDNPSEFVHYLNPHSSRDTQLLGISREEIAEVGLTTMEDIDHLPLRVLESHIISLKQISHCMAFELQGGGIPSELQKLFFSEINDLLTAIQDLSNIPHPAVLDAKNLLRPIIAKVPKVMLTPFTSQTIDEFIKYLDQIQEVERERQLTFFKAYTTQNDIRNRWVNLIHNEEIFSLTAYCQKYPEHLNMRLLS